MDIVCGNLKVLFMHMSYSEITYSAYNENFINNCFHVNKNKFLEKCQLEFLQRSVDEHENCYRLLCEDMKYKSDLVFLIWLSNWQKSFWYIILEMFYVILSNC